MPTLFDFYLFYLRIPKQNCILLNVIDVAAFCSTLVHVLILVCSAFCALQQFLSFLIKNQNHDCTTTSYIVGIQESRLTPLMHVEYSSALNSVNVIFWIKFLLHITYVFMHWRKGIRTPCLWFTGSIKLVIEYLFLLLATWRQTPSRGFLLHLIEALRDYT